MTRFLKKNNPVILSIIKEITRLKNVEKPAIRSATKPESIKRNLIGLAIELVTEFENLKKFLIRPKIGPKGKKKLLSSQINIYHNHQY